MFVSPSIYLEAFLLLLGDNSERTRTLVKDFMAISEKEEVRKDLVVPEDALVDVYKYLIKSTLTEKTSQSDANASKILLLKVKSDEVLKAHPVVRDILTDVLSGEDPVSANQIDLYIKRIRNIIILATIEEMNRKIFAQSRKVIDIKDVEDQENELIRIKTMLDDSVKYIDHRQNLTEAKASDSFVSLSDKDSVLRSLEEYTERNVRGVIRTGLHGLNKALGSRGGMGLGEMVVFPARSHNYKSGMLVSIAVWTAIYNKFIPKPGKKPMVYFVSLENEVSQNLIDIFRMIYCRVEGKAVDLTQLSNEYIAEWIIQYFSKFGIEVYIDRYAPHEFSYNVFIKRYNHFMEHDYEILVFILDYLSESRKIDPGDTFSAQGTIQLIKENYTKFRSHANSQGYLSVTGHQLIKKASDLANSGTHAVKKFNSSLMADSSDVERIVDILIYLNIESNVNGHSFLTAQLRKNRGCKDTPERDKFFAYPFTEFGIVDDIDGPPQYVTDINGWDVEGGVNESAIVDAAMF